MKIDGKSENVLPKEIVWDPITDEPIHIDFLRIVKGAKIVLHKVKKPELYGVAKINKSNKVIRNSLRFYKIFINYMKFFMNF